MQNNLVFCRSVPVPINPSDYRVFAGSVLLTNNSSPELFRMVVNITRHSGYTGSPMFVNDIAIITVSILNLITKGRKPNANGP